MHELTKKGQVFRWTEECQDAFDKLKQQIVQHVILSLPKSEGGDYILDTDASDYAIGAVLSQMQDGVEKVLAFGSRCLSSAEKNYCVTRKELLAVVYFMEYYKHYLVGRRVVVRSDHGSLRWLKNLRNPSGQVARWIEKLAPFDWKIIHRAGRLHNNCLLYTSPSPRDS